MRDILLPEVGRQLYACWYRHPDVLDALTALYATWSAGDIAGGTACPVAAAAAEPERGAG